MIAYNRTLHLTTMVKIIISSKTILYMRTRNHSEFPGRTRGQNKQNTWFLFNPFPNFVHNSLQLQFFRIAPASKGSTNRGKEVLRAAVRLLYI